MRFPPPNLPLPDPELGGRQRNGFDHRTWATPQGSKPKTTFLGVASLDPPPGRRGGEVYDKRPPLLNPYWGGEEGPAKNNWRPGRPPPRSGILQKPRFLQNSLDPPPGRRGGEVYDKRPPLLNPYWGGEEGPAKNNWRPGRPPPRSGILQKPRFLQNSLDPPPGRRGVEVCDKRRPLAGRGAKAPQVLTVCQSGGAKWFLPN